MDLTVPSPAPTPSRRTQARPGGRAHPPPAAHGRPPAAPPGGPPSVHHALVGVALPGLAVSPEHGQLTGHGLEGFYQSGRRLLSRCHLRVFGREPVPVQGRLVSASRARFVALVRTPADPGPDPGVAVERSRDADGSERITLRNATGRPLRVPVELTLGTDLSALAAIASGRPGPELRPSVYGSGLRWSAPSGGQSVVTAEPPPKDALASTGLLRWELDVDAGAARTITLHVHAGRPLRPAARSSGRILSDARAEGDDPRAARLLATALDDLRSLLVRDPAHPADLHLAAGVPWRTGPAPAETLWAARMLLPLGTRLAVDTLRGVARSLDGATGASAGRVPGPLRDAGPHLPPACTGVEATLAFPAVLAEARLWGLPEQDLAELLPAAERCLAWLCAAVDDDGLVAEPGPAAGVRRAETQAHAHRAALLGADLLEACGRDGADAWRDRAHAIRRRFRESFWLDDPTGGRPAAALTTDGRPLPHLGCAAAHLLDTGLVGGGGHAGGLLDTLQTEQVARLLGSPALDTGWGLRGLGTKEPGHNPFGHRAGAVRVHETAVAVVGLASAGYEKEATGLVRGLLDAAEAFAYRLPEMYGGDQRTEGGAPVPHPSACRPAAVAAAAAVHVLAAVAGIRPDVPAGTVALHPLGGAPLGALRLSGLSVAGESFAVRVSRMGLGMVEEAAAGLQLGV
ncbi:MULTISPECIES: glycogen debranching N-terminal domain-containing protein [Streptomyces]|uniref:Glycogen debranching protein n=2 Tax=Streptomyces TaxID=1883 RepID=A0A100Y4A8_9ACTN|nr:MULTISPECIES: glycogen debranching N-terminal domain-containing protein [Streptomyces]KUH37456.1 glycogen debranching protein [Streptomyces kanasensis]UUS33310.1 glycogen debranching protein [Streptomyces changanensis]